MSTGIVICASTRPYLKLARKLIASVRLTEGDWIPICLFTTGDQLDFSLIVGASEVRILNRPTLSWGDKIEAIAKTPFEKTIYIDCDVMAVRPFAKELEKALNHFPFLCNGGMSFNEEWEYTDYPIALSQMNSGVIAFKSSLVPEVFERWKYLYNTRKAYGDQATLRASLLDCKIPWFSLASEWNCQPTAILNYKPYLLHFTGDKNLALDDRYRAYVKYSYEHVFDGLGALASISWQHIPGLYYCPDSYTWKKVLFKPGDA